MLESCRCGDVGYFVVPNKYTGEPDQEQCEFCYTNVKSKFYALRGIDPSTITGITSEFTKVIIEHSGELTKVQYARRSEAKLAVLAILEEMKHANN